MRANELGPSQLTSAFAAAAANRGPGGGSLRIIDPTTATTLLAGSFELPRAGASLPYVNVEGVPATRAHAIAIEGGGSAVLMKVGNVFTGTFSGVWSLETGAWMGEAQGCFGGEPGTYLWADDGFVASAAIGGRDFLWSIRFAVPRAGQVEGIALAPDGQFAAVTWFRGDSHVCGVSLFDLRARCLRWTLPFEGTSLVSSPVFSPAGTHVLVGTGGFGDQGDRHPPAETASSIHFVDVRRGGAVALALPPSAQTTDFSYAVTVRMEFVQPRGRSRRARGPEKPAAGFVDVFESLSEREVVRHRLAWDGGDVPSIVGSAPRGVRP